jgi:hypothetical protein
MKFVVSTLIAAGLLTAAVQSSPLINSPPMSPTSAALSQVPQTVSQYLPGECCNDDFRQALPLWDSPTDTIIAKP